MDKDCKKIHKDLAMLVFYMQGGLDFKDAYMLSNEQIEVLIETVQEHYERQNNALNSKAKG